MFIIDVSSYGQCYIPATGRLMPGERDSAHWPSLVCAHKYRVEEAAVEKHRVSKEGGPAGSSFLSILI